VPAHRAWTIHYDLEQAAAEFDDSVGSARAFLGGRGYGVSLVAQLGIPAAEALDPRQPFVLAAGPLTGTAAPSTGRFAAVGVSPLTGTIFDSNAGGRFGVRLRQAGVMAVVVTGRAPEWCVLVVDGRTGEHDGAARQPGGSTGGEGRRAPGAEPRRARGGLETPAVRLIPVSDLLPSFLPGRDTATSSELVSMLRGALGPAFAFVFPGLAGRKGSFVGSLRTDDRRNLGRGGLGAALAAKHLLAVAVAGDEAISVADPERFSFVTYEAEKQISANPVTSKALPEFGTAVLMRLLNNAGALPVKNFQAAFWDKAEQLSGEVVRRDLVSGRKGCMGCRIRCTPRVGSGPAAAEGPEYETLWALGADCGIDDLKAVQEGNRLCGELGLDTISTGATIACAMEIATKGPLDCTIKFGDARHMLQLVQEMGLRESFGAELADGSLRFARRHHRNEASIQVKGLECPAYDPRGMVGQGLAYATSNRGACHLRGNMVGPEILGIPKMLDRFSIQGKSGILINLQHLSAVFDSACLCKFAGFAFGEEMLARLLSAATGRELSAQDVLAAGERIWNLERLWNLAAGFTREDDTLPQRLLAEPLTSGPSAGHVVELEPMLDEYYRARGWDRCGVPSQEKIGALGLREYAERFRALAEAEKSDKGGRHLRAV